MKQKLGNRLIRSPPPASVLLADLRPPDPHLLPHKSKRTDLESKVRCVICTGFIEEPSINNYVDVSY